jgi:hypothetical protein
MAIEWIVQKVTRARAADRAGGIYLRFDLSTSFLRVVKVGVVAGTSNISRKIA